MMSVGTKHIHTDKKMEPAAYDRDVPEQIELLAEFPSGVLAHARVQHGERAAPASPSTVIMRRWCRPFR